MVKNATTLTKSVLIFGLMVASGLSASEASGSEIAVTGSAKAKVPPDYATLHVNLQHLADKAEEATDRVASVHQKVMESLLAVDVTQANVSTSAYGVGPHWERRKDGERKFKGYVARHQLVVNVQDMETVGKVVDAVIQAGATSVSDVKFVADYADSLEDAVLAAAVRQARRRADTIAQSAGGKLGDLIELSTGSAVGLTKRRVGPREMLTDEVVTSAAMETVVVPQMITVSITVFGRWQYAERD